VAVEARIRSETESESEREVEIEIESGNETKTEIEAETGIETETVANEHDLEIETESETGIESVGIVLALVQPRVHEVAVVVARCRVIAETKRRREIEGISGGSRRETGGSGKRVGVEVAVEKPGVGVGVAV